MHLHRNIFPPWMLQTRSPLPVRFAVRGSSLVCSMPAKWSAADAPLKFRFPNWLKKPERYRERRSPPQSSGLNRSSLLCPRNLLKPSKVARNASDDCVAIRWLPRRQAAAPAAIFSLLRRQSKRLPPPNAICSRQTSPSISIRQLRREHSCRALIRSRRLKFKRAVTLRSDRASLPAARDRYRTRVLRPSRSLPR